MNPNASWWRWTFINRHVQLHGQVLAVDPRDALSRVLTSSTATGNLFGIEHEIPISVLDDAPANGNKQLELTVGNIKIYLQKLSSLLDPPLSHKNRAT